MGKPAYERPRPHPPCADGERGLKLERCVLHQQDPIQLVWMVNEVTAGAGGNSVVCRVHIPQRRPDSPIRTRRMGSGVCRAAVLATDLLHHGHEAHGVGVKCGGRLGAAGDGRFQTHRSTWRIRARMRTPRPHPPCADGERGLWLERCVLHQQDPIQLVWMVNEVTAGAGGNSVVCRVHIPQRRPDSPIRTRRMGSGVCRAAVLATDLLHHGHEAHGVGDWARIFLAWPAGLPGDAKIGPTKSPSQTDGKGSAACG